jgi:DNA-directed RNA polymerase beta' subunit
MAHRVRVMPFRTLRFNECVCKPYNADFDGDEMNLHCPQNIQTMSELKDLAAVPYLILAPRDGKPSIEVVQDTLVGSFRATKDYIVVADKQMANLQMINSYFKGKLQKPSKDFTYTGRGQSSVSIHTGLVFRSEENTSLLTINPVNYFNNEFETISTVISTSWLDTGFPLAIKSKIPNKEILIKAGEPIATIIPISLSAMDKTEIQIFNHSDPGRVREGKNKSYGVASQKINSAGKWTNWYRNATDENGISLGKHEVTTLRLSVKDNR